MTESRPLDRILHSFFEQGSEELSDRVLAAALDEIDQTKQRRRMPVPWRFPTMLTTNRLAAAALIGVLAIGGALYVLRPSPSIGPPPTTPTPSPVLSGWALTGAPDIAHGVRGITVQLVDGRVLSAAGTDGASSSAELYDPAAAAWAATSPLRTARSYPAAVRLQDGRVLVAGGYNGQQGLASTELFDPATDTWLEAAAMNEPRQQAFAVALADGRVLVGGGGTDQGNSPTVEIYDPAADAWTRTGDLSAGRAGPLSARLLPDGRVLVAGGFVSDAAATDLFDPTTGTWSPGPRAPLLAGDEGAAVGLPDGKVLLVGGAPSEAAVFDPTAGTWTPTGPLAGDHDDLVVAVTLADGRVLAIGGDTSEDVASTELYDPTTNQWSAAGPLASARFVWSATMLANGSLLVVGSSRNGTLVAEVLDPSAL